jgi:putative membrane protein
MKIRTAIVAALIGSAGFLALPAMAQTATAPTARASMSADEYARRQAQGELFEIALSQLILDKSEDQGVRAFAEQMVAAHTASLQKLRAASGALAATLPSTLDSTQQNTLFRLENISGMKFNLEYMQLQIDGHKQALDLNRRYAANGTDPALRQYASEAVTMIQDHLSMAQKVRAAPPITPGPKL